jgi:succinate dehydrogenase / fumarate reductase cytochrome b subunit
LQTLGWSTTRNDATLRAISRIIAIVIFAGFVSVPLSVMTGLVR